MTRAMASAGARIVIDGMVCKSCTSAVTSALERTAGVRAVSVSLESKSASVTYDPSAVDADVSQIRFVGVTGDGWRSDMAIDDVSVVVAPTSFPTVSLAPQVTLSRARDDVRRRRRRRRPRSLSFLPVARR